MSIAAIIVVALLTAAFLLVPISVIAVSTHQIPSPTGPAHGPLISISGNNTYIVWARTF